MIPLPKLLDGNLQESRRIRPVDVSISEKISPLSYATMTLADDEDIPVRSYVELFTPNGSAGVFRTKSRPKSINLNPSVDLEHSVSEIGDFIVRADIQQSMTLANAMSTLFGHYDGNLWQLGTISYTDSVIVDTSYEPVLQAIMDVLEQVPQYYLTFNFSTSPWTLSLSRKGTTVSAEGRLGRNVESATVTIDDTDMCTRAFVNGLPLHSGQSSGEIGYMDADTISTYGVIEKVVDSSGNLTQEQATLKATAYLNSHKKPKHRVSISGVDFYSVTGESLDKVQIAKLYRLALPDYDEDPVEEVITGLNWQSVYQNPLSVTVELDEEGDPVIDFLAKQSKSARSGSRSTNREMNDLHYDIYSDDGLLHTSIVATASNIRTEVGATISGMAHSIIEQTATYIRTEVENAASSISASVIEQTADYVRTEVASVASGVAWAVVEQTMTNISQQIGRRARVYVQWNDPADSETMVDGDLWYKKRVNRTWDEIGQESWNALEDYKWQDLYGIKHYVWKNGAWVLVADTAAIVESEVNIEHDSEHWAVIAKQVDINGEAYRSNLSVTAQKISTEVRESKSQLYSTIDQTAREIRAVVGNTEANLKTVISVTATGVYSSVNDYVNGNFSTILQTSTSIALAVASARTDWKSEIKVERDRIGLVVTGTGDNAKVYTANIVAGINAQTGSYATIQADKINLEGYVTASELTTNWLTTLAGNATYFTFQGCSVGNGGLVAQNIYFSTPGSGGTPGSWSLKNFIKEVQISGPSSNTYKLQYKKYGDESWTDAGSFSRATSLSGAWSSGTFTVTASPQGNTCYATAYAELNGTPTKVSGWQALLSVPYIIKSYVNGSENPTSTGKTGNIQADATVIYNAGRDGTTPFCAHSGNTEMSTPVNLGWNETYSVWAGFQKSDGTYKWSKEYKIHGKALPSISNVDRKSTGISGTSAGDVHTKTGGYVTFDMGGSSYYIRIE